MLEEKFKQLKPTTFTDRESGELGGELTAGEAGRARQEAAELNAKGSESRKSGSPGVRAPQLCARVCADVCAG
jgi:hypothetical protein